MISIRRLGPWVVAALLAFSAGCSSELNEVTGTVTLDGEPLQDAMVMFTPLTGGRPAAAKTDAQGNYQLIYSREDTGAILGEHVVSITTGDELAGEEDTIEVIPERVPAKYNYKSELRRTVESGPNEFNFELESGGEILQSEADLELIDSGY